MKTMKKFIILFLLCIIFYLSGCGKDTTVTETEDAAENSIGYVLEDNQEYLVYFANSSEYSSLSISFKREKEIIDVTLIPDNEANYYAILKEPGDYEILFSCYGYQDNKCFLPLTDTSKTNLVFITLKEKGFISKFIEDNKGIFKP